MHLILSAPPLSMVQSGNGSILPGSSMKLTDAFFTIFTKDPGTLTLVTPIPGALPLFASALVLLGWLVRRRRVVTV